jgi:hypothetical protein
VRELDVEVVVVHQADEKSTQSGGCAAQQGRVQDRPFEIAWAAARWGAADGRDEGWDGVGEEDGYDDQKERQAEEARALGYGQVDARNARAEVKLAGGAEADAEGWVAPNDVAGLLVFGETHEACRVLELKACRETCEVAAAQS